MKTIAKIRFEDGHTEMISEDAIKWARAIEPFISDPAYAKAFDSLIIQLKTAAVIRGLAKKI